MNSMVHVTPITIISSIFIVNLKETRKHGTKENFEFCIFSEYYFDNKNDFKQILSYKVNFKRALSFEVNFQRIFGESSANFQLI